MSSLVTIFSLAGFNMLIDGVRKLWWSNRSSEVLKAYTYPQCVSCVRYYMIKIASIHKKSTFFRVRYPLCVNGGETVCADCCRCKDCVEWRKDKYQKCINFIPWKYNFQLIFTFRRILGVLTNNAIKFRLCCFLKTFLIVN